MSYLDFFHDTANSKYFYDFNGNNTFEPQEEVPVRVSEPGLEKIELLKAFEKKSRAIHGGCYTEIDFPKFGFIKEQDMRIFKSREEYLNVGNTSMTATEVLEQRKKLIERFNQLITKLKNQDLRPLSIKDNEYKHPYQELLVNLEKVVALLNNSKIPLRIEFQDIKKILNTETSPSGVANPAHHLIIIDPSVLKNLNLSDWQGDFALSIMFHELVHIIHADSIGMGYYPVDETVIDENGKSCVVKAKDIAQALEITEREKAKWPRYNSVSLFFSHEREPSQLAIDTWAFDSSELRMGGKQNCPTEAKKTTAFAVEVYAYQSQGFLLSLLYEITADDIREWMKLEHDFILKSEDSFDYERYEEIRMKIKNKIRRRHPSLGGVNGKDDALYMVNLCESSLKLEFMSLLHFMKIYRVASSETLRTDCINDEGGGMRKSLKK